MIDCFALLEQPRAPWLDEERLKTAYHAKTFQTHPDTRPVPSGKVENAFASVNEAYQILQDPKRRLHHLLSLEGSAPDSSGRSIPKELEDLFPATIAVIHAADQILEKTRAATNALSRSLLKSEVLEKQQAVIHHVARLSQLYVDAIAELQTLNAAWARDPKGQLQTLTRLYLRLTYLTRWKAQLEEKQFQLSLC